jgi:hypothetical protein
MRRLTDLTLAVALILLPMLSRPVLAHHGSALWSPDEIRLKGTVVEYVWRNPHVLVIWDVKDDKGNVVQWTGELASPETLMADGGMTKSTLKPGDEVIIYVRPARSGAPHSLIDQIRRADGTMVLRYSRQGGGTEEERASRDRAREARDAQDGIKQKN